MLQLVNAHSGMNKSIRILVMQCDGIRVWLATNAGSSGVQSWFPGGTEVDGTGACYGRARCSDENDGVYAAMFDT